MNINYYIKLKYIDYLHHFLNFFAVFSTNYENFLNILTNIVQKLVIDLRNNVLIKYLLYIFDYKAILFVISWKLYAVMR